MEHPRGAKQSCIYSVLGSVSCAVSRRLSLRGFPLEWRAYPYPTEVVTERLCIAAGKRYYVQAHIVVSREGAEGSWRS